MMTEVQRVAAALMPLLNDKMHPQMRAAWAEDLARAAIAALAQEVAAVPASIPDAGDVFTVPFPFVRDTYSAFDGEGWSDASTWKPGVRFEAVSPEDDGSVADAIGSATFTVEAVYKPGRFPTRVFFTRKFRTPDGKEFGKGKLHIVTLEKFRRLSRGYQHPFGIGEPLEPRYSTRETREVFEKLLAELVPMAGAQ